MAGGSLLRSRRVLYAVPVLVVLIVALGTLPAAGLAGLLTGCSAAIAVVMARAAVGGRAAGPRLRALTLAGGAGLAALAGLGSGIAALLAPHVLVDGVPLPAEIPLVTLFLVAALYLPAVLRPSQRRDQLGRLRFGLDVLGVTACLIYASWVPLFSGGDRRGAAMTALVFGGGAAATAAVAGVHAIRHRAALQWCAPAAALSLIGLTALVIAMDYPGKPNAAIGALVAAGAVNVAAGLLWYGSVRVSPDVGSMPAPGSEPPASFPLLALLILGSALITAFHLINGGRMDATSILLGTVALSAVATREWVTAVALRRQAGRLTVQGNRLRTLMYGSADVAMVLDSNLAVRWQSPAAARQFGLSDQEVLGRTVSALVHPDQVDAVHAYLIGRFRGSGTGDGFAVRLRDGFGRWRETEWAITAADPADPENTLVIHIRDVTNVRGLEEALRQSTHLDRQTGLANRDGLLCAAELIPDAGAMIVIELDGLTATGDVHGRDHAEFVLVEAARRLRAAVAEADVPARIGEARFAVLTHCGAVRAHLLASQLVNALSAPYPVAGTVSHLSAWAGLDDVAADDSTDEVIRRAGLALRSVRSGAPGAVEWYDAEMETRLLRRSTLEQDLSQAIERGHIDLHYQPIVELPGRQPVGIEVTPVWRHATLGPVPAGELCRLAEDLGLLADIGHRVLHRSCRLLADWRRLHESLWLAVNVRPRQLLDPAFEASLHTALEKHQLPPSALVIEIDEQDLADVEDVAAQLGRLRAQGLRTAVDSFGAGPTSLSRLRILPIDLLKIDQSGALLDVAVTLGHRLGLEVVAHGVQEEADLETAQAAGCRLGQGDLLGRPMPAERLEAMLA
ncbi:EAL domain-containing protein [Actinoplanes sp. NBC_00393]|uniref:EAL domain-containing protein n=1 Tax=Actinoplanes sp. NBC_00393 TaxID=2975953 RepID=UPI002E1A7934